MSAHRPICAARQARSNARSASFPNPEQLAYRQKAEPRPLYRVRFTMAEIWGEAAESPGDTLDAEIFAHWLIPAGGLRCRMIITTTCRPPATRSGPTMTRR